MTHPGYKPVSSDRQVHQTLLHRGGGDGRRNGGAVVRATIFGHVSFTHPAYEPLAKPNRT
jgi:hypothetical protein